MDGIHAEDGLQRGPDLAQEGLGVPMGDDGPARQDEARLGAHLGARVHAEDPRPGQGLHQEAAVAARPAAQVGRPEGLDGPQGVRDAGHGLRVSGADEVVIPGHGGEMIGHHCSLNRAEGGRRLRPRATG